MTMTTTDSFALFHGPAQALHRVKAALQSYGRQRMRTDAIASLQALSDADLARQGLTRDAIVLHVFRDRAFF